MRAFLVQLLLLLAAFSSEDGLVVSICGGVHRHALQQLLHWRRSVQQLCGMGAMRASLVCYSLAIAQVTSLEPQRWCTRCPVHSTAATVPYVLGQTTHPWVDRHDRLDVCSCTQPRLLVGAAPRVQLRMKLGAQEVQAALRQTQQRFAGGFKGTGRIRVVPPRS